MDSPSVSAVSSEQLHAFQESQQNAQSDHTTMILQPTQSDDDDVSTHDLAAQFQRMLAGSINNDDVVLATSTVDNVDYKGLIVDFQDHGNLVPIFAEYDDPLMPKDYYAYGCGSLNW